MTTAQAILIIGGLANFLFSALVGYLVLWVRARDVHAHMSRYSIVAHTNAIMNASLLLGLAVAIPHTGFLPAINIGIAIAEVIATVLANVRNVVSWKGGFDDAVAQGSDAANRLRGLANMLHLFDAAAILYGVTRTALGV